jgi:hypothetical protein
MGYGPIRLTTGDHVLYCQLGPFGIITLGHVDKSPTTSHFFHDFWFLRWRVRGSFIFMTNQESILFAAPRFSALWPRIVSVFASQ